MNQYIIATGEGRTLTPNDQICENLQILGFALGNTKEEAIKDFIICMEDENFFELEGWDKDCLIAYQLNDSELN